MPDFAEFGWKDGAPVFVNDKSGAQDKSGEPVIARGFQMVSMRVEKTRQGLATDMISRHPWMLDLPRSDLGIWTGAYVYANYFTSVLPNVRCVKTDEDRVRLSIRTSRCEIYPPRRG